MAFKSWRASRQSQRSAADKKYTTKIPHLFGAESLWCDFNEERLGRAKQTHSPNPVYPMQ